MLKEHATRYFSCEWIERKGKPLEQAVYMWIKVDRRSLFKTNYNGTIMWLLCTNANSACHPFGVD